MAFLWKTLSHLFSNSLFSTIVTLYTLIFLYLPSLFHHFVSSPIIISTLILLLSLLRLGAAQAPDDTRESGSQESDPRSRALFDQVQEFVLDHDQECVSSCPVDTNTEPEPGVRDTSHIHELLSSCSPDQNPGYADSFLEWDVRAPLEVIYEEYNEGEEPDENDDVFVATRESQMNIIQRYATLSLFYPESDSDCSSEEDFRTTGHWEEEDVCSRWEEEDDRDGLIEIALDEKRSISEADEDNLIEIDLSPAGY